MNIPSENFRRAANTILDSGSGAESRFENWNSDKEEGYLQAMRDVLEGVDLWENMASLGLVGENQDE